MAAVFLGAQRPIGYLVSIWYLWCIVHKYLHSSSEWQASVRSVKLRSATLCTGVFLFYIKRHLMSGNEFACSLGSSSVKIAWVWTQKTRWKTLANNARRYSSRCVRALSLSVFAIMQRKCLPDGSRVNRQFPGWFESLVILTALLLQRLR